METEEDEPLLIIMRIPAPLATPTLIESDAEKKPEVAIAIERSHGTLDVLQSSLYRRTNGASIGFTSTGRNDGVGAQALGKITTRVMAAALNKNYAHAPFRVLEHYEEKLKQFEYCKIWEDLLQIGNGCSKTSDYPLVHSGGCDRNTLNFVFTHNFQAGKLYVFRDCHDFTERYRDELVLQWQPIIESLRVAYHATSIAAPPAVQNPIQVAVHIRRGDAIEDRRLLDNDYYLSVMRAIENKCPTKSFFFNIVSEGTEADFKIFSDAFNGRIRLHISPPSPNVRTSKSGPVGPRCIAVGKCIPRNQHLLQRRQQRPVMRSSPSTAQPLLPPLVTEPDEPLTSMDAFNILVAADVLVLSRSAFSYLAALYSRGVKLHPPDMWWSIPRWCEEWDRWYPYDKNDKFFDTLNLL